MSFRQPPLTRKQQESAVVKRDQRYLDYMMTFAVVLAIAVAVIVLFLAFYEVAQERQIRRNKKEIKKTITNCSDCPPGPPGPTGINGTEGEQGEQGETGLPGVQGFEGPVGDDGPPGIPGLQGEQGAQGIQGIQGINGTIGPNGTTGTQGTQGQAASIEQCNKTVGSMFISVGTNTSNVQPQVVTIASVNQWVHLTQDVCDSNIAEGLVFLGNCSWQLEAVGDTYKIELDISFETVGISDPEVWIGITFDGLEPELKDSFSTHGRPDESMSFRITKTLTPNTTVAMAFLNAGNTDNISIKRLQLTIVGELLCGFAIDGPQGPDGPQGDAGITGPQGDQGVQGLQGDQGINGTGGIQGIDGVQGIKGSPGGGLTSILFLSTDTFVVPANTTVILGNCQAGGGGGGSGGAPFFSAIRKNSGGGGGGGASGDLRLSYIDVNPGETLNVFVGVGGAGGIATNISSNHGVSGGPSFILRNGTLIFDCFGGLRGRRGDPAVFSAPGKGGRGGKGFNGGGGGGRGGHIGPSSAPVTGAGGFGINQDGFSGSGSKGGRGGGTSVFGPLGGLAGICTGGITSGCGGGGGAAPSNSVLDSDPIFSDGNGGTGGNGAFVNQTAVEFGMDSPSRGGGGGGGAGTFFPAFSIIGGNGGDGADGYIVVLFG